MKPEDFVMTCPHCASTPTPFSPKGESVRVSGQGGTTRQWRLGICPACGGAAAFESTADAGDTFVGATPTAIPDEWSVGHLPEQIERDWHEAGQVFKVGAYASAVVACGRTLEAAADALGIEGRSLQQRLKRMRDGGLVTVQFAEAMDYARLIRNTGAHAGSPVSRDSASGTMRFTLQALRMLFEVPGELDTLRARPPELEDAEPTEVTAEAGGEQS